MIASIVYLLCAVTSLWCAWLLFSNFKKAKTGILFWSGLCFACLSLSNVALFIDLVLFSSMDLYLVRTIPTVVGVALLAWGLIWESA